MRFFRNDALGQISSMPKTTVASPTTNVVSFCRWENSSVAATGEHWERLVAIKSHYDPNNFFRLNQNIRPQKQPVMT